MYYLSRSTVRGLVLLELSELFMSVHKSLKLQDTCLVRSSLLHFDLGKARDLLFVPSVLLELSL
jgi:hypothetical protein